MLGLLIMRKLNRCSDCRPSSCRTCKTAEQWNGSLLNMKQYSTATGPSDHNVCVEQDAKTNSYLHIIHIHVSNPKSLKCHYRLCFCLHLFQALAILCKQKLNLSSASPFNFAPLCPLVFCISSLGKWFCQVSPQHIVFQRK